MNNWDYSKRFRSFSEAWPTGCALLLSELQGLGFAPRVTENLKQRWAPFEKDFFSLTAPGASKLAPKAAGLFTYVQDLGKLADPLRWGLVFVDAKHAKFLSNVDGNFVEVLCPEAAVDWTLKKIATPQWHGVGQTAGPSLAERFPAVFFENPSSIVVGPHVEIGAGTILESGVRIGARVKIGESCRIGSHSRLADDVVLGRDVQITASVSLGGQGFGFIKYPKSKRTQQRLHVGRTLIGDTVRLGAFVGVDRGVFEDTVVGAGTSIDNIMQIGHNVQVGVEGRICSFVGLAGSTIVGDHVMISGLVATKGHIKIGDRVMIAGQTGITSDVASDQQVKGYPQRPVKEALKISILQGRLPEFFERIIKLEGAIFKNKESSKNDSKGVT